MFTTSGKAGWIENISLGSDNHSGKLISRERCLHFITFELESRLGNENFNKIVLVNVLSYQLPLGDVWKIIVVGNQDPFYNL